uniref:Adrenoceptor alpha 2C n=1 Tax=Eptatretus burgeri TaxID=7764 RepID=A0A8C4QSK8_EPTBU
PVIPHHPVQVEGGIPPFRRQRCSQLADRQLGTSLSPTSWEYSVGGALGLSALVTLLIFTTVFGNSLVIVAVFTRPSLKAPQNLFLVSLATADILVATLVIPFSLFNELMGYWYFGRIWCEVYLALDVLFCSSSIVHLCAISLDRYWSRTPRRIKRIILIVWLIAIAISLPPLIPLIYQPHANATRPECEINDNTWYILGSSIVSFFLPCLIMVLVYARIYHIVKFRAARLRSNGDSPRTPCQKPAAGKFELGTVNGDSLHKDRCNGDRANRDNSDVESDDTWSSERDRRRSHENRGRGGDKTTSQGSPGELCTNENADFDERMDTAREKRKIMQARERRFTFVLAVVIGVFVVCWFPFFFTYSLIAICRKSCHIPKRLFKFFFWFGYCNSCLNPMIYTIFNQDFRRAFKKILCSFRSTY